ncbi:GTP-binding protein [Paenibacillus sp. sptzw28]|uniref:CobW family GTP-binding protein n=1 Tax=Paenibacillus sp. sptzw28 TaxID=715179 RepID=UPI001C6E9177|nr:CobW family GTP-binding protein [Paenibacillus sp. sptzw28]QYR20768.1 GTP-binding protein [Paenibacillus sp. sptzw28]
MIEADKHKEIDADVRAIPVHLLSGFLGSGKTTLLNRVIDYYKAADVRAAVIMNELGDVNLDGQLVDDEIPMAEMLGGCICCTIRGDLGMELRQLIEDHRPDVVLIESTGAANPMEIIDAVTEAALLTRVDLRTIATVVDGPELLARSRRGGRTYKLMQDQIRCATDLIVNKADKLDPEQLVEVQQLIRELNGYAPLTVTVRCVTDMNIFDLESRSGGGQMVDPALCSHERHICGANCNHSHSQERHEADRADGPHTPHVPDVSDQAYLYHESHESNQPHMSPELHVSNEPHEPHESHDSNGSHAHVMALTHYFAGPVDSHSFEAFITRLPKDVYRAKGIVTFTDTNSRFLFQYAYRELEFTRINPQGQVHDVAVFIGEHFSKNALERELESLS